MPGFFEALKNFKPKSTNKKHFVTIDDKKIEVSLEKSIEIKKHGIDKYELVEGVIKLKKVTLENIPQTELVKTEKGYKFYQKNPFWVESIGKGHIWKIKQKS